MGFRHGAAFVILAGCFWSLGGLFLRLVESADEWQILFYRSLSCFIALLVVLFVRHGGATLRRFGEVGIPGFMASVCLCVGFVGFVFALIHTSIANAMFVMAAAPLGAAVLATGMLGERVTPLAWAAMAAAVLGVGIMVGAGVVAGTAFGNVAALVSTLAMMGFAVALRFGREADMLPAVCLAGLCTTLISLAFVDDLALSPRDLALCVAMGVLQIGASLTLFTAGSRYVPAAELTLLSMIGTVLAPAWVWLVMGEVPRLATLLGGVIVLAAIAAPAIAGARGRVPSVGPV
jgi:drug/metabolite transporter (DMT)-like permease